MPTETQSRSDQAAVLQFSAPATPNSPKSQRIFALDFTKGTLVLIMVLYHWINYFIGIQWKYYFYMRFLTPSFIFITGFMISHVYLAKYAAADSRLWKRLITRGLKLMAIFLALNLARNVVSALLGTNIALQDLASLKTLFNFLLSGNLPDAGVKLVSFSILVPISYLLMLSGALVLPYRRYKYTFHVTCVILLSSIAILGFAGIQSYNLEFVAIGMLGVLTGFTPIKMIEDRGRHPYWLAFAYIAYLVAITIWNVPFLLLIVGVLLNLWIIYLIGNSGSQSGAVRSELALLGKYSLFGYISQIAILQILNMGFHRMRLGSAVLPISFLAAFVLTIVSVEVVDRSRVKFRSVDRLYRAVFA